MCSLKAKGTKRAKDGDDDIGYLTMELFLVNENTLRFRIRDAENPRFEIPESVMPLKTMDDTPPYYTLDSVGADLALPTFSFSLTLPNKVKLMDIQSQNFIYQDKYLELGLALGGTDSASASATLV